MNFKSLAMGLAVASLGLAACSDAFLEEKKNYNNFTSDIYNYYSGANARISDLYQACNPNIQASRTYQFPSMGYSDELSQSTEEYYGFSKFVDPRETMQTVSGTSQSYDYFDYAWGRIRNVNDAIAGIEKLKGNVDTLIVIPNDKLLDVVDRRVSLQESFIVVDEVLLRGVQGISDIITIPGLINVDFADVKSVMQASGSALMGIGRGTGEGRAVEAAKIAINSQLLETSINGASGVIVNITGGPDMTLHEVTDATNIINDAVLDDARVIIGAVVDDNIQGEIQITVIATGFELRSQMPIEEKVESRSISAAEFFSGAFNSTSAPKAPTMSSFSEIQIPDFLRK